MNSITTPARVALHRERFEAILNFWFGSISAPQQNYQLWFGGTPAIDADIKQRFLDDVEKAERGEYDSWMSEPHSALALCIAFDQFPMNIYRDQPKGYIMSSRAIPLAYTALGRGFDAQVHDHMKLFFQLPLMHSEHLADQLKCVEWMKGDDFAKDHCAVVQKYGRYPGRNAVMGRTNTAEEAEYLKNGGNY